VPTSPMIVEISDDSIRRRIDGAAGFLDGGIDRLKAWSDRYDKAVLANDSDALPAIGREMFDWLDAGGAAAAWAVGEPVLEVWVDPVGDDPKVADAVLDAPWELLAPGGLFLAAHPDRLFTVSRRIGTAADPVAPRHSDLSLMFLAAAPEGQTELDYEAEEAAILAATRGRDAGRPLAHLVVEESGSVDFLAERIAVDAAFEALHLSCHGTNEDANAPMLAMETPEGALDTVTPDRLIKALGATPPPLVFLSACLTAAAGPEGLPPGPGRRDQAGGAALARDGTVVEVAGSYARRLTGRIPNVLGWDGSVFDRDAITFAEAFYGALSLRHPVPEAAALARRAVLESKEKGTGPGLHWHLARVYLGSNGGGPVCANALPARRAAVAKAERAFLDPKGNRVPVATRAQFVGRRRQIQAVLRAYRDGRSGVLIHGMGNLGKSSLAARVSARMPGHLTAVVFEHYDALSIFNQIVEALPAAVRLKLNADLEAWRAQIAATPGGLEPVLRVLLEDALTDHPMLLIVDDLERALEEPAAEDAPVRVKPAFRESLIAVLRAFAGAETPSRLLVTSRYDFALPDDRSIDVAESLVRVQLRPMPARERQKQWQAARRAAGTDMQDQQPAEDLLDRALAAAGGNPGLQEILTRPLLAGEADVAAAAVAAVERYRETGEHPAEGNAAQEFFRRVSFETYEAALTEGQRRALAAATVFSDGVPIPLRALEAAAGAIGVADPEAACRRLLGLGLLDDWGIIDGQPHAAVNPLARPLAGELTEAEAVEAVMKSLPAIADAWQLENGTFSQDARAVETIRLALLAEADASIINPAAEAAIAYLFRYKQNARVALDISVAVLAAVQQRGTAPAPWLVLRGIECAQLLGSSEALEKLLIASRRLDLGETFEAASLLLRTARLSQEQGDYDAAVADARAAAEMFDRLNYDRDAAIARGQLSDIYFVRGELDEALRIRTEEELPVYERLGDVRSRAVTIGLISDILRARGLLDEALRSLHDDLIPTFERLGDIHSKAVTMGKIADIHFVRGELDEALRIRTKEQLPVYERLGDVRAQAVTMGQIADIHFVRGQLDEALRIRREEELPVYKRLGDVRSKAMTMGKVADILKARGQLDQALDMHLERLEIHRALQHVDGIAHTRFSCAQIRLERGDHQRGEIQSIYEELQEAFDINKHLQRPDGVGAVGVLLAQVLAMGGHKDEALAVLQDARSAFELLKMRDGVAHADRLAAMIRGEGG